MKKILSDPTVALVLTVILCMISVLLNTKIRLGKESDRVYDYFYSSPDAVAYDLRELCNASEQLMLLGVKADIDNAENASVYIDMIRNALRAESRNLKELYDNYNSLLKETFRLESTLARTELSDVDSDACSEAQHNAAAAKAAIDASGYNNMAKAFQHHYKRFPTTLFAAISGVSIPQIFA